MSTVERFVEVDVPVRAVYDQWTQFEEFPRFMGDVVRVEQLDDTTTRWVVEVAGSEREWIADITEQEPDRRIAWRSRGEVRHAGVVTFQRVDERRTRVLLQMEFEPGDWREKAADVLGVIERTVERDLQAFKGYIEERGRETGAWRGRVEQDPTT